MSTILSTDAVQCTGIMRRTIPHLHRYNSSNINVGQNTQVRIPFNTLAESLGTSGIDWDSSNNQFVNSSGLSILVMATYNLRWTDGTSQSGSHSAWFRVQKANGDPTLTYAKTSIVRCTVEPCSTGTCIILLSPNDRISLETYQTQSVELISVAASRMPGVSLTII